MKNEICLTLHIPTQTASTTDEWYVANPHKGVFRVKEIKFAPATAVAIDATNVLTSTVTINDGAGGAFSSAVASHTTLTGGNALALGTTLDLTLTQVVDVQEGYQFKFAKTVGGTGAILDGTYSVLLEKIG